MKSLIDIPLRGPLNNHNIIIIQPLMAVRLPLGNISRNLVREKPVVCLDPFSSGTPTSVAPTCPPLMTSRGHGPPPALASSPISLPVPNSISRLVDEKGGMHWFRSVNYSRVVLFISNSFGEPKSNSRSGCVEHSGGVTFHQRLSEM